MKEVKQTDGEAKFLAFYPDQTRLDYRVATLHRGTGEIESKLEIDRRPFDLLLMAQAGTILYDGFDPPLIIVTDLATVPKQNKHKLKLSAPLAYWLEAVKLSPLVAQLSENFELRYGSNIGEADKRIKISRK